MSYNTTLNQHAHIQEVCASFLFSLISICPQAYIIHSSAGNRRVLGVDLGFIPSWVGWATLESQ